MAINAYLLRAILVGMHLRMLQQAPSDPALDQAANKVVDALNAITTGESIGALDRYASALRIAAEWPHPAFKNSLLSTLNSDNDEYVQLAIIALSRYHDPSIDNKLRQLGDSHRTIFDGQRTLLLSKFVDSVLTCKFEIEKFEDISDEKIVDDGGDLAIWLVDDRNRNMTVQAAAIDTATGPPSVRLQAWLWLCVKHHISVANAAPLKDSWGRLSESIRIAILRSLIDAGPLLCGDNEVRLFIESCLTSIKTSKNTVSSLLIEYGAMLGSELAHTLARDLLSQAFVANGVDSVDELKSQYFGSLFRGFAYGVRNSEIVMVLEWTRFDNERVREGAIYALAGLDDARATHAVLGAIALDKYLGDMDPRQRLMNRMWPNERVRQIYLIALVDIALAKLAAPVSSVDKFVGAGPDSVIDLVQRISDKKLGDTGKTHHGVDLRITKATIAKWQKYLQNQDFGLVNLRDKGNGPASCASPK